jgi:hypothetical protein
MIKSFLWFIATFFKSTAQLERENADLKKQIEIATRESAKPRQELSSSSRKDRKRP